MRNEKGRVKEYREKGLDRRIEEKARMERESVLEG